MEIKAKLYPYPILAYYSHDYAPDSHFIVSAVPEVEGFKQKIIFSADLNDKGLNELIHAGKAEIIYHLECAQTGYREVLHVSDTVTVYPVEENKVSGKLQVCPFVIAREKLPDYTNESFDQDLKGMTFEIEEGNILALSKQINVKVKKKTDDLRNLPSIINVVLNGDNKEDYMVIDYDGSLINVMLPDEEWNRVDTLSKNDRLNPVFNCVIAIPAISYVLSKLQRMSASERQALDDGNIIWYDCIKRSLLKNFKIDIESEDFESLDSLRMAQQLVNGPLNNALKALSTEGGE